MNWFVNLLMGMVIFRIYAAINFVDVGNLFNQGGIKMRTVKITKIKELKNARHPNNIPVGAEYIGENAYEPAVGHKFIIFTSPGAGFQTSRVQEILSPDTFKTSSSIYKWEVVQ